MAIRFKENLRWLRKQAGLSQRDIANIVHVTPEAVCQWETGKTEPSFETLEILANLFGLWPGDLLNDWGR